MQKFTKTISIDEDLMKRIEEQCEKEHRSFSNFAIHAILLYLDSATG